MSNLKKKIKVYIPILIKLLSILFNFFILKANYLFWKLLRQGSTKQNLFSKEI